MVGDRGEPTPPCGWRRRYQSGENAPRSEIRRSGRGPRVRLLAVGLQPKNLIRGPRTSSAESRNPMSAEADAPASLATVRRRLPGEILPKLNSESRP